MPSKWVVYDRYGNEIYLTQERWAYILRYHLSLTDSWMNCSIH